MTTFIQLTASGLALGAAYALIALGFVVIYRATQVFNFAQGEMMSAGAFIMVTWCEAGVPWALALVLSMLSTGVLGALIERGILRPLVGRPVFVSIILTLFVALVLRALIVIVWGPEPRGMPTPWDPTSTLSLMGAHVLVTSFVAVAAGAVALLALYALFRTRKLGVAMRATSYDQEAALSLGIPVGRVFQAAWAIAGMVAALAGVFLGAFPANVEPNLGYVALRAFPAVIVGGLSSSFGAALAGLCLGVLEVWTQAYVSPHLGNFGHNLHAVLPYLVMIAFLMARPYGLFGRPEVKRV